MKYITTFSLNMAQRINLPQLNEAQGGMPVNNSIEEVFISMRVLPFVFARPRTTKRYSRFHSAVAALSAGG